MSKKKAVSWELRYTPHYFNGYLPPNGFLNRDYACHALWYYYLMARLNYENDIDTIKLETEKEVDSFKGNFNLFRSIAQIYGVAPEKMLAFWTNVDMQRHTLNLPDLPEGMKFRAIPEIRTQ